MLMSPSTSMETNGIEHVVFIDKSRYELEFQTSFDLKGAKNKRHAFVIRERFDFPRHGLRLGGGERIMKNSFTKLLIFD